MKKNKYMETEKLLFTLFIFGNFKGKGAEGELLQPLLPITCDESLKYVYEPFTMTVQFDTDLPKEELLEYLKVTYKPNDVQYYLVPKGEEIEVELPEKIKKNLKDLETNSDRVMFIKKYRYETDENATEAFDQLINFFMKDNESELFFEEEDEMDPMLKPKEQLPTLDDLLDKMIEGNELSLSEKELLTKYSNEYK